MSQHKVKEARRARMVQAKLAIEAPKVEQEQSTALSLVEGKVSIQESMERVAKLGKNAKGEDLPQISAIYSAGDPNPKRPKVYWTELAMPYHNGFAHRAMLNVAMNAVRPGFAHIPIPFRPTDLARNSAVATFLQWADDPNAVLIMLDADHIHPQDVIAHMSSFDPSFGVVGALAFKRDGRPLPCWFRKDAEGKLGYPENWEGLHGLVQCDIVGTGAIAIRRWVFDKLEESGHVFPYFRIPYFVQFVGRDNLTNPNPWPGEDVYFGVTCIEAGIPHYVDVDYCTPHLVEGRAVDREVYDRYEATGILTYQAPPTTVDDVSRGGAKDATSVAVGGA